MTAAAPERIISESMAWLISITMGSFIGLAINATWFRTVRRPVEQLYASVQVDVQSDGKMDAASTNGQVKTTTHVPTQDDVNVALEDRRIFMQPMILIHSVIWCALAIWIVYTYAKITHAHGYDTILFVVLFLMDVLSRLFSWTYKTMQTWITTQSPSMSTFINSELWYNSYFALIISCFSWLFILHYAALYIYNPNYRQNWTVYLPSVALLIPAGNAFAMVTTKGIKDGWQNNKLGVPFRVLETIGFIALFRFILQSY